MAVSETEIDLLIVALSMRSKEHERLNSPPLLASKIVMFAIKTLKFDPLS